MRPCVVPLLVAAASSRCLPAALGFVPSHLNGALSPCSLGKKEYFVAQRASSNSAPAASDADTANEADSSSQSPSDKYADKIDWAILDFGPD